MRCDRDASAMLLKGNLAWLRKKHLFPRGRWEYVGHEALIEFDTPRTGDAQGNVASFRRGQA